MPPLPKTSRLPEGETATESRRTRMTSAERSKKHRERTSTNWPEGVWVYDRFNNELRRLKTKCGALSGPVIAQVRREAKMHVEKHLLKLSDAVSGGRSLYASAAEREQERKALAQLKLSGPRALLEAEAEATKALQEAAAGSKRRQQRSSPLSAPNGGHSLPRMTRTPAQHLTLQAPTSAASSSFNTATAPSSRFTPSSPQRIDQSSASSAQIGSASSSLALPHPHTPSLDFKFQKRVEEMHKSIFDSP